MSRDPQNLSSFQGLAADFRPRFLAVTQDLYGSAHGGGDSGIRRERQIADLVPAHGRNGAENRRDVGGTRGRDTLWPKNGRKKGF